MMKRLALPLLLASLLAAAGAPSAFAQDLRPGRDYRVVSDAAVTPRSSIEVIEFFSYACPHCNDFHPLVGKWAQDLPKDVSFRRVPVDFGRAPWAAVGKLYYTLEATGELRRLDDEVFRAVHVKRERLQDEQSVLAWAQSRVSDSRRFADAYRSFDVQMKLQRAQQLAARFDISAVPSIVVGGRYLVLGERGASFPQLLALTDRAIDKARADAGIARR